VSDPAHRWHFDKIEVKTLEAKKSAKDALFEIGKRILKTANAPETIDLKLYKYNIIHKLAEEIDKLSEEKAAEILQALKKELETW
jgi:hypothetical protein